MLQGRNKLNETFHDVGVNASSFFQEMHHFTFLSETLVSDLKAGASLGRTRQVRLWSAACSTGEEAYSIAISLLEGFRDASKPEEAISQPDGWHIEVVASDIDPAMLAVAEERIYNEDALATIPPEGKKRYFLRGRGDMTGRARVKKDVADLVHFRRIDLEASDWPVEGLFDVIFFRNALNYLERQTQELLLRRMLRYLSPHGYLILGHSESVPWLKDAVLPAGNTIYQLRPHGTAKYAGKERRTQPRRQRKLES
jgi:chemotaxis protein methyltransferase CheR